jgi:glycosyltransferase involved in cell wall biosynthesis
MKDALAAQPWVGKLTPIHIKPFILKSESHQSKSMSTQGGIKSIKKNYDFIYVATGEPHKNHPTLIEAWCLLAEQNLFPSLCLTLDQKISKQLCKLIESKQKAYGINVFNSGANTHDQIMSLYSQTRALIFPSILESFGLPLIEARDAGLPILASELDYVRDSIDPVQTFDPFSAQSIARAVKRFIEVEEKRICIIDGTQFLASLLGDR